MSRIPVHLGVKWLLVGKQTIAIQQKITCLGMVLWYPMLGGKHQGHRNQKQQQMTTRFKRSENDITRRLFSGIERGQRKRQVDGHNVGA